MVEFGTDLSITYVMGGLARTYEGDLSPMIVAWLDAAAGSQMPIDPRLWSETPISSSYPACMAVKAASEQGPEAAGRYLRAVREGLMCFRRKLDSREALVEEARGAGLDVQRFRASLESHAIVEAFGADLEETRSVDGLVLPSVRFEGDAGVEWVFGAGSYEEWKAAAVSAGGRPGGEPGAPQTPASPAAPPASPAAPPASRAAPPASRAAPPASPLDPLAAVTRFGRAATIEIATICDLPAIRAEAELWRLAAELRLKPVRVLTGTLWELP
jgi:hypothetical protein